MRLWLLYCAVCVRDPSGQSATTVEAVKAVMAAVTRRFMALDTAFADVPG